MSFNVAVSSASVLHQSLQNLPFLIYPEGRVPVRKLTISFIILSITLLVSVSFVELINGLPESPDATISGSMGYNLNRFSF